MKIVFMGTPDIAKETLENLYEAGHEILAVVTTPDKEKGRGLKKIASPVKEYALEKNIKVYQPDKIRNNVEFIKEIKELNPDVICVVAYGKILPKELLDIPKLGCINVHPSLLPKYRGAAPIQWAVLNGDEITGVTIMYMDEGMDTGDIIIQEKTIIGLDETTGELWKRLSKISAQLLVRTMEKIENGTANRKKQEDDYTIAPMIEKEMAKIDWDNKTGLEIKNLVRGLNPFMGAYTYLENRKIKLWAVDKISQEKFLEKFPEFKEYEYRINEVDNGIVLYVNDKQGLYIKAKDSIISVLEIQGENSKRMSINAFLRGNKILAASKFE